MAVPQTKTGAAGKQGPTQAGKKTPPQATPSPDYGAALEGAKKAYDSTWGATSYGSNRFSGASSDTPGHRTISPLAASLETGNDVLAEIRNQGTARSVNVADDTGRTLAQQGGDGLLRDLASGGIRGPKGKPSPAHDDMSKREPDDGSPGGSVPGTLNTGAVEQPVRKPS